MQRTKSKDLLIGAHTSAAGGAYRALLEGASIGATTIQLFTTNQKQWKGKKITEGEIEKFKEVQRELGIQKVMSHASYLINLGSPAVDTRKKSHHAFIEEIERCLDLELAFLNFHPGAALKEDRQLCLDRICESLLLTEKLFTDDSLTLLLETTAGQGSVIGFCFEELAYILEKTHKRLPIGVCIDTCHIFAAGYDIRTFETWELTLKNFDKVIGLEYLHAFHLNDSQKEWGSRRDRHAPLGEGEIGIKSFEFLMRHPITREIPKYLETPGGCPLWDKEIWKLREFATQPLLPSCAQKLKKF